MKYPAAPRIPAQKSPPGELLVWALVRHSLRGMFARVRLRPPAIDPRSYGVPILAVANHPSWWDGYLALLIGRWYGLPRYLMMEEAQLRRYRFFAWAGCFSVERRDPREAGRSIAYAANILTANPSALVWIFPQGAIAHADTRPITVHSGAAHVLRRATAAGATIGVLPVAWEYVFRGEQRPEAFIRVGELETVDWQAARDPKSLSRHIQAMLTAQADALRADVRANALGAYGTILRGRGGVNDVFDRLLLRDRLVPDP